MVTGVIKYVVRRGEQLVEQAFIATGNEENDLDKAVVVRETPSHSSSSDVLQATIRLNAEYEYQKRAVHEILAIEQKSNINADVSDGSLLLSCCEDKINNNNAVALTMLAAAMRAANVDDFYMTKYLSKAQQTLGRAHPAIHRWAALHRRT